jgi:hypothetical protein
MAAFDRNDRFTRMAYLRNGTVNLLNLHYGVHSLVLSGAGAFFAVYLLKAGVPAPAVLASFAGILLGRFLIRPLILGLVLRIGLRATVAMGTILSAIQYPILAEVHGVDRMLLAVILAASVGDTLYWTTYHAYYAQLGDAEHRGHQLGAREALAATAAILGPLIFAWALTSLGPRSAFSGAAIVQVLAALPFLGTPDVPVKRDAPGAFGAALPGFLLFVADGWANAGAYFVWQVALFLLLGQSYAAFGGAMALAGLAGAIGGLLLGRHIDAGHGARAVMIAYGGFAALILFRAATTGNVALAVTANAAGALVSTFYVSTLMTAVYNLSKHSPCSLRFHIAAEGGWDLGGAGAALLAAGLSASGLPLAAGILPALAGTAVSVTLLLRYFGRSAKPLPAAGTPPA